MGCIREFSRSSVCSSLINTSAGNVYLVHRAPMEGKPPLKGGHFRSWVSSGVVSGCRTRLARISPAPIDAAAAGQFRWLCAYVGVRSTSNARVD